MAQDHDNDRHHQRQPARHLSRRQVIGAATAGLVQPLSQLAWADSPEVALDMSRAVQAWLAQLDARQRASAQLAWSRGRLEDWHYVPRARAGLPLRQMSRP